MYNIIDQQINSTGTTSMLSNDTTKPVITTTSAGYKIDCAKECPCGVPVIPVPDQWLEVMVTGGFKVWHIIFIIIAFLVTIVVVYCCFHRCRIPRTKQEIEADLMRSNLTNKFRDYLQEFPNEPTTFLEALKRVQDLEEKAEQDDPGARKRKGWLKRMGKERQAGEKTGEGPKEEMTLPDEQQTTTAANSMPTTAGELPSELTANTTDSGLAESRGADEPKVSDNLLQSVDKGEPQDGITAEHDESTELKHKKKKALKSKKAKDKPDQPNKESKPEGPAGPEKPSKTKSEKQGARTNPQTSVEVPVDKSQVDIADGAAPGARPTKVRKKRDKPNLSRTKGAYVGSRGESMENHNVLTIPVASHHGHHHHHQGHHSATNPPPVGPQPQSQQASDADAPAAARRRVRSRTREPKESTVIQIDASPPPPRPPQSKSKREKK